MEQIDQGLDRIISKTEDMHRNGAMTVAQLYAQGETMRRALDELDDQEDLLDEADFTLQKLEVSCCWQFCCCCCCCQPEKLKPIRGYTIAPGSDGSEGYDEPLIKPVGMKTSTSKMERKSLDGGGDRDQEALTLEDAVAHHTSFPYTSQIYPTLTQIPLLLDQTNLKKPKPKGV